MLSSFKSFLLCGLLLLAGCDSVALWKSSNANYDKNKTDIQTEHKTVDTPPSPVLSKHQPYVDTHPVSLNREPDWYHAPVTINGANLPFNFYLTELLGNTPADVHTDIGVNPGRPVTLHYSGTLKGALKELAAKSNYYYDYNLAQNTITWSALETKTFDISFIPGVSSYNVGNASGAISLSGGSSSGSSSSSSSGSSGSSGVDITQTGEYSSLAGSNVSIWDDIKETISTLLSPQGKISVSQATTTVTVRDHPSNISNVDRYIQKMNKILSKQVHFDVQVLDVSLSKQFQYGINWNDLQYHIGSSGGDLKLNAPFGTASGGILTSASSAANATYTPGSANSKWSGNLVIQALEEQGKVSVVTQPSVTTLNDQVAQITIQNQRTYLASQTSTISGQSSLSQQDLVPGTVNYGFQMYLLPKIQDDKIFLEISSTLSSLVSLSTVSQTGATTTDSSGNAGTSANSIQVPLLDAKTFNQRSVLRNGQTLVLAGFKTLQDNNQKDSVAGLTALGGMAAESNNEELVFLITPTILSGDNF